MSLELALAALRNANRIDGTRASYRKDNPAEYDKVMAYLDGSPRPTGADQFSLMGQGLVWVEDERRGVAPPPPPPPPVADYPAGTHVLPQTRKAAAGETVAGVGSSSVLKASSASVEPLLLVENVDGVAVRNLKLDGENRSKSRQGLKVRNAKALLIDGIESTGFANTANHQGGAVDILGAIDLELANSKLTNSADSGGAWCSGVLGLGAISRGKIHDLEVVADRAYCIKGSGATRGDFISDTEIWNCVFRIMAASCSTWNNLCVEFWGSETTNSRFHHNWLNGVLSMANSGTPLASGKRWRIDHNRFDLSLGGQYAMEIICSSSEIDHNYVTGGNYPIGHFQANPRPANNDIHHNVFDGQQGPTAAMHYNLSGVTNAKFHHNTVVMRQSSWRDGVFSLLAGSTIDIRDNIFYSTVPIGDKLGNLPQAVIDHNLFFNISPRGANALSANPQMPLSGGFPNAYIPANPQAQAFGAFADGVWSDVGPQ